MNRLETIILLIVGLVCAAIVTVLLAGCTTAPTITPRPITAPPLPVLTSSKSNAMMNAPKTQSFVQSVPKSIVIAADWAYNGNNYFGFYAASMDGQTWSNIYEFPVTNACTVTFTNLESSPMTLWKAGSHF